MPRGVAIEGYGKADCVCVSVIVHYYQGEAFVIAVLLTSCN